MSVESVAADFPQCVIMTEDPPSLNETVGCELWLCVSVGICFGQKCEDQALMCGFVCDALLSSKAKQRLRELR